MVVGLLKEEECKIMEKILNTNWKNLIKPSELEYKMHDGHKADIVVTPLEPGYGYTLGNALRRVLLKSLYGSAITAVKIEGVEHEFSTIDGVKEDVVNLLLNLKQVVVNLNSSTKKKLPLRAKGPAIVKAGDIDTDADVEILNPDAIICTLEAGAQIAMELTFQVGRGYVLASEMDLYDHQVGLLYIDALYSPIRQVSYKVENTRVGQMTDYDKLTLSVETNGFIKPETALGVAARILQDQLEVFINFEDQDEKKDDEEDELPYSKHLLKKVDELELSVRSQNCLKNDNIVYIGDLVVKTEVQMLKTPNFGRKSLVEIRKLLKDEFDLKFGMDVAEWPPENLEKLSKKHEDSY